MNRPPAIAIDESADRSPGMVPLSRVALRVGVDVDELARRLHDRIVTDDAGTCCLTCEHARAVLVGGRRQPESTPGGERT